MANGSIAGTVVEGPLLAVVSGVHRHPQARPIAHRSAANMWRHQ